jgi:hypothetical protein
MVVDMLKDIGPPARERQGRYDRLRRVPEPVRPLSGGADASFELSWQVNRRGKRLALPT